MTTIKGQNLRLRLAEEYSVAAATSCTVHLQMTVSDSSTKDSEGDWTENEVTGMQWDASTDALVVEKPEDDDTGSYLEDLMFNMEAKTPFILEIEQTAGEMNRTCAGAILRGMAIITDLQVVAQNRNNATLAVKFQGTGELEMLPFLATSFKLPCAIKDFSGYILLSEEMTAAELASALEIIDSEGNTISVTNSGGSLVVGSGLLTLTKDSNNAQKWNVVSAAPSTTILSIIRIDNS